MSDSTPTATPSASAPGSTPGNSPGDGSLRQRVQQVLDRIRPAVQSDGGDIELVDVTEAGIVRVRMLGACVGCPSSTITLQMGIERNLKERVPQVVAVEQVM